MYLNDDLFRVILSEINWVCLVPLDEIDTSHHLKWIAVDLFAHYFTQGLVGYSLYPFAPDMEKYYKRKIGDDKQP